MNTISYYWSKAFLTSRRMLWTLFWFNFLGTFYGYVWYWNQMMSTVEKQSVFLLFFVPDSPTASLFFTLSILYMLMDQYKRGGTERKGAHIRSIIEALAVVTSVKYGVWAVAMIVASGYQGAPLNWQDGMLMTSHSAMAVEALLFVGWFSFRRAHLLAAAIWTLSNDYIDYHFQAFPWLSSVLYDDLTIIEYFTIALSLLSILFAYFTIKPASTPIKKV